MSTAATTVSHRNRNFGDVHFWISLVLALALFPLLIHLHLPTAFDWAGLGTAYWLVLAAQSIFVATLLCAIGFAPEHAWRPALRRFREQKLRIVVVLAYFLVLAWTFTWLKALVLTVDALAIIELRERLKPPGFRRALTSVLLPAAYLFAGFLVVFAYNDVILS